MTTCESTMKKVYLINDTLLFEPDLRRLGPLEGYPYRATTLHGPVSECLLLLLENNDQVVKQRTFFASVWEKQGTIVSTNALYQTISQIRKVLKSAGMEENIIKTLPKEGFKSIAQVRVGELGEFVSPKKTAPVFVSSEESVEPVPVNVITPEVRPKRSFFHSPLAYGLAGLLFIISCSVLYSVMKVGKPWLVDYQSVGQVNGCALYSSWHENEKSREMFDALSKRFAIQCKPGGTAWMTVNFAQQGNTVIVCDRQPQDIAAQCDSIIYRQHNHEDE